MAANLPTCPGPLAAIEAFERMSAHQEKRSRLTARKVAAPYSWRCPPGRGEGTTECNDVDVPSDANLSPSLLGAAAEEAMRRQQHMHSFRPLLPCRRTDSMQVSSSPSIVLPVMRWSDTLLQAELQASMLANELLQTTREHGRGLLAQCHHEQYHWDQVIDTLPEETSTKWSQMTREEQIVQLTSGMTRLAWKSIQKATNPWNTVQLEHFQLEAAVERNYHNTKKVLQNIAVEETLVTRLSGDEPACVSSADGYRLIVHLPGGLRGKTLHDATEAIEEWGRKAKPTPKGPNNFVDSYKKGYELTGRTRLATLWHAIGHKHEEPVVCADMRRTGQSYEGAFKLFVELDLVNAFCTTGLLAIDPLHYDLLQKVYDTRQAKYKSQAAIAALDKYNLWEGHKIMFNRWSPAHFDQHDPHFSWACVVYFGDFKEAVMKFHQINTEVRLRPGDVIYMRGRDLLHEVPKWGEGQRHFMVYFTHEVLWDHLDVPEGSSQVEDSQ